MSYDKLHPDTLVQPNKVTVMRYAVKDTEENVVTLVVEQLKDHMSSVKKIQTNLWGEPVVYFSLKDISPNLKPERAFQRVLSLQDRKFAYTYTSKKTGKEVQRYGVIFPTVDRCGNELMVKINIDAIPYLLYIGDGATYFSKSASISLKGSNTKRLYKFLSSWKSKGATDESIEQIKFMLDLVGSYKALKDFKNFVLEPAKKEMFENEKSDIWFEYSTYASGENGRSHDRIKFKIFTRYIQSTKAIGKGDKGDNFGMYKEVYGFLQRCVGLTSYKAMLIADACKEEGEKYLKKRYEDTKKLRDEEKPKAFNFFMKSAQKESNNEIFKLRYRTVSEEERKKRNDEEKLQKEAIEQLKLNLKI